MVGERMYPLTCIFLCIGGRDCCGPGWRKCPYPRMCQPSHIAGADGVPGQESPHHGNHLYPSLEQCSKLFPRVLKAQSYEKYSFRCTILSPLMCAVVLGWWIEANFEHCSRSVQDHMSTWVQTSITFLYVKKASTAFSSVCFFLSFLNQFF